MCVRRGILVLVVAGLTACGGGGGGGGDGGPAEVTVHLSPIASLSGRVYSDGLTFVDNAALVGDAGAWGVRLFRCFPLTSIPAGITILEAGYFDEQVTVSGTPYTLGDLSAAQTSIGSALDGADYGLGLGDLYLGILSTTPTLGPRAVDLTARLQALLDAGGTRIDVMLRFPIDGDGDAEPDLVQLSALGSGDVPRISVRYQAP